MGLWGVLRILGPESTFQKEMGWGGGWFVACSQCLAQGWMFLALLWDATFSTSPSEQPWEWGWRGLGVCDLAGRKGRLGVTLYSE